ncbi:MAG TPA: hypothetical protein VJ888_07275 [Mobilitalea sp.]|nr:hypothetical protein [Mobilitalea sp.]
MGGYEIIVKTEEVKRKSGEGDYASAQRILDTIDLKKIKNMADLSLMAEVCSENGRYEEAMELLQRIYHKSKTRKVVYQLVLTSIKKMNVEDAEDYLKEYILLAPGDFYRYIFRYQIDKIKGEPYETLIETLKTLKKAEHIEEWAYELAKLYYKAGMEEECINECSDLILWFGEGSYVEKAKILKAYYSGEVDKDMIIKELKKRAVQENRGEASKETMQESSLTKEEDTIGERYDIEDFTVIFPGDEASEELSVAIKDDVEEIFSEEVGEKFAEEFDEVLSNEPKDEPADESVYDKRTSTNDIYREPSLSNEEQAEQEVEDEIYRLLAEEDDDEDSTKLIQISENYNLNLDDIFGYFLHVKTVRRQLVKSMESILDKHNKSVQMIITGTAGSGKTTLAKGFAIFLNKTGKLKSSKVAKISAENLNIADISSKKESLRNCCLVIENASELKRSTIEKLLEIIRLFHGDMAVIFEENKKNMNKLFRECPKLMDMFKNRIHLPQYTEKELLGFAYSYIKSEDYLMQKEAQSALMNVVSKIASTIEPSLQWDSIQKVITSAIASADARTAKQLSELVAQGRLGEAEILTLLSEDFKQ